MRFLARLFGLSRGPAGAQRDEPRRERPQLEARALLSATARVLAVMVDPPGRRESPRPGDLEGVYDFWFDGGAAVHPTGPSRRYDFADGATAWESTKFGFGVRIALPDGSEVTVSLTGPPRSESVI